MPEFDVALFVVGAAAVVALVAAPVAHSDGRLQVSAELVTVERAPNGSILAVEVALTNRGDEPIEPIMSTWDRRRKPHHFWTRVDGDRHLGPGERDVYRWRAPDHRAQINPVRAVLTIRDRGEQQVVQITVDGGDHE